MINFNIILPHIKKYGGVRRYLEFGNALIRLDSKNVNYNIWLIDYSNEYEWIKELDFQGNIFDINNIEQYDFKQYNRNVLICGDATSLHYMDKFENQKLKIINIIFPLNSGYIIGDYGDYIYRDDPNLLVIGNSTGWYDTIGKRENYHTIPGAVNLDMFYPETIDRIHNNFSVLFMAKNRPWKGYDQLVQLVEQSRNNKLDIDFSYFDTEQHPRLDELGVKSYVNIPQSEMRKVYSSHDCFLSFEQLAGWQNTVAEAMACHTNVITTDIGTYDIAKHNETALVLDNETDYIQQANTYLFLLRENDKLRLIKDNALKNIYNYSWENYAKEYLDLIYEKLSIGKKRNYKYVNNEINQARNLFINQYIDGKEESPMAEINKQTDKEILEKTTMVNENKDISNEDNESEISKAIQEKANQVHKFCRLYGPKKALVFDKFDKYGAYHWQATDKPYLTLVQFIVTSIEKLTEMHGTELKLLDVGCGDGYVAYRLKDYFSYIHGIDVNETAIRLSNEKKSEFDVRNIEFTKQDFFETDLSNYDVILMSQFIEQFEHPEEIIDYLDKFKDSTKLIMITTPLAKNDGSMWDTYYHAQEFFPEDLTELVKPFNNDYMISLSILKPYQQVMVLENKYQTIYNYLNNIFFNQDFEPTDDLLPDITSSIMNMMNNKPQTVEFDVYNTGGEGNRRDK